MLNLGSYIISNPGKTKFSIRDSTGRFTWTTNSMGADRYTYDKAKAIINNNLGSGKYVILYLDDLSEAKGVECVPNKQNVSNVRVHNNDMTSSIEKIADSSIVPCENIELDAKEILGMLSFLDTDLKNYKQCVENDIIRISRALTDINHYKEQKPKRAANARCKLDVFETNCLIKRRELKDQLYYIECIEKKLKGESYNLSEERSYIPRELNDLFKEDKIPDFNSWW